jgi:hypothetical protein
MCELFWHPTVYQSACASRLRGPILNQCDRNLHLVEVFHCVELIEKITYFLVRYQIS